jgi:hypothetical protein
LKPVYMEHGELGQHEAVGRIRESKVAFSD